LRFGLETICRQTVENTLFKSFDQGKIVDYTGEPKMKFIYAQSVSQKGNKPYKLEMREEGL